MVDEVKKLIEKHSMSGIREGETSPNWETKKVICLVAKETD
jgi:hypothetical protein